jgi:hypothetical protein
MMIGTLESSILSIVHTVGTLESSILSIVHTIQRKCRHFSLLPRRNIELFSHIPRIDTTDPHRKLNTNKIDPHHKLNTNKIPALCCSSTPIFTVKRKETHA